jgi:hypothetical protein
MMVAPKLESDCSGAVAQIFKRHMPSCSSSTLTRRNFRGERAVRDEGP